MARDQYRDSHIAATSSKSNELSGLIHGEWDLIVLASSWDKRCLSIIDACDLRAKKVILLEFLSGDPHGLNTKHNRKLENHISCFSDKVEIVEVDSRDVESVWPFLIENVWHFYQEVKRPLNILYDLSSCPRYLSLGLMATLIKNCMLWNITYFYSEGVYPEEDTEESRYDMFTEGGWDELPIPSLEGDWDPEKKWMYLISVGFEGSKTHRLVSRAEPDRITILFPDPPVQAGYDERTRVLNQELYDHFGVNEEAVVKAHAADAVGAWRALSERAFEKTDTENTVSVCCGTKPHSLALALRSIVKPKNAVTYVLPESHKYADIRSNGVFWRYNIRDLSVVR